MKTVETSPFRMAIGSRIEELMIRADLTVKGLAAFLKVEKRVVILILEGKAIVSNEILHQISRAFGIRLVILLNATTILPERLTKSKSLIIFKKANEKELEYFVSMASRKKEIRFFYENLLHSKLLAKPVYLKQIQEYAVSKGYQINVHLMLRYLSKMVEERLIIKNMALIRLKDGDYGSREVAVYSRNKRKVKG